MSSKIERKLTTILAADAEGYSRRMEADEVGTFDALHKARDVFAKFIDRHNGRIANTAGDALIADFPSVVEAVNCAIEVQRELGQDQTTPGGGLPFRIGIHLGDVIIDGDDLLGEGVNLAARLQSMADPGGILVSQQVFDQVENKLTVGFEYLGEKRPKNFSDDVSVYRVSSGGDATSFKIAKQARKAQKSKQIAKPSALALRAQIIRRVKLAAVVFAILVVIDLATGPGSFAQFPGIVLLIIVGWQAAPLFSDRFAVKHIRIAVALVGLILISGGGFWVLFVLLVVAAVLAIRRLIGRPG